MHFRFLRICQFIITVCALGLLSSCHQTSGSDSHQVLSGTAERQRATVEISDPGDRSDLAQFLPNRTLTPGATLDVTVDDVCTPGYTKKVRNVPTAVKRRIYDLYGIRSHEPGEYEIDHLISLELGGSNSAKNLWPQSYRTQPWNAHVKDRLEDRLHNMVCSGQLDMKVAQQAIALDWIAAYRKYVGGSPAVASDRTRIRAHRRDTSQKSQNSVASSQNIPSVSNRVWVNTRSGAYWRPGGEYYGKTKEGAYMSEAEAIRKGYHAAGSNRR